MIKVTLRAWSLSVSNSGKDSCLLFFGFAEVSGKWEQAVLDDEKIPELLLPNKPLQVQGLQDGLLERVQGYYHAVLIEIN